jgi:hypothetical protein
VGVPCAVVECVLKLLWIGGIDGRVCAACGRQSHDGGALWVVGSCSELRLGVAQRR